MNDLANIGVTIPAMSQGEVQLVRNLESELSNSCYQHDYPTQHAFHAGMYARTVRVPAGHVITGALIEIPTMLVISGDVTIYIGEQIRITGYNVTMAEAGRKQAFYAHSDTHITMIFPTTAKTVDEAEREFTKEYEMLQTRRMTL